MLYWLDAHFNLNYKPFIEALQTKKRSVIIDGNNYKISRISEKCYFMFEDKKTLEINRSSCG